MFAIEAESEQAVHDRPAADNWTADGMLRTASVEAWEVLGRPKASVTRA
jgi:hypothetical protein